jgi:hypothetical protein
LATVVIPIPHPERVTSVTTRSGFTYRVIPGSFEILDGGVARFRTVGRSFSTPAVVHMFREEVAICSAEDVAQ